jgi:oligopeptide transport system substrate-binding protein
MSKILLPLILLATMVAAVLMLEDERPRADFVMAQAADFLTLDPNGMSHQHDLRISKALYEPLVTIGPNAEIEPAAAESWEVSEDERTWTFHLRDGLRFSNGDPVTSGDFVAAWRRGLLPDTKGSYSSFFDPIRGARAFSSWREAVLALRANPAQKDELVASGQIRGEEADAILAESGIETWNRTLERFQQTVGISTPDDRTLVVELEQRLPYFLDYAAFGTWSPVHRPSLEAASTVDPDSGRLRVDPSWAKAGRLIGNGPFRLVRWRYLRDCRLERNEHYWNAANVPLDSIEVVVIEDPNTAIMAFRAGEVDWITDVNAEQTPDLLAERAAYESRHAAAIEEGRNKGLDIDDVLAALPPPGPGERRDVHGLSAFGTDFFHFNCRPTLADGRSNPLADPRVRRALAAATDKRAICERVIRLGEQPADTVVPPDSIPGYESPAGLPFDADLARASLAEAGWTLGDDGVRRNAAGESFPTIEILYSTSSTRFRVNSIALRDMWRRELSIPVEVRGRPTKGFNQVLKNGEYTVARGGWFGDYGDPTTFLDMHRTGESNNRRGYSSAEFDGLMERAATERDPEIRLGLLQDAERIIVERDLPVLPISNYRTIYMYEPGRVRGLTHHPRLEQHPARLWIDRP